LKSFTDRDEKWKLQRHSELYKVAVFKILKNYYVNPTTIQAMHWALESYTLKQTKALEGNSFFNL
jgi:hypothetical protein